MSAAEVYISSVKRYRRRPGGWIIRRTPSTRCVSYRPFARHAFARQVMHQSWRQRPSLYWAEVIKIIAFDAHSSKLYRSKASIRARDEAVAAYSTQSVAAAFIAGMILIPAITHRTYRTSTRRTRRKPMSHKAGPSNPTFRRRKVTGAQAAANVGNRLGLPEAR